MCVSVKLEWVKKSKNKIRANPYVTIKSSKRIVKGDALMNSIIHEIAEKISKEIAKNLEDTLIEGNNISEFILKTKKTLDEVGVHIVGKALETVDGIVKNDKVRKQQWNVKAKASPKSLSTIFGEVKYKRTYYANKITNEFKYLSDESLGIESHDKMDVLLESRLIEESIDLPYRKSGEKISENIELTGQTVMNAIRKLEAVSNNSAPKKACNRDVKILYIEADEDHVSLQNGRCVEPRLVYVHEGKQLISKDRYRLINPRYFSGVYKESADLWLEVADYIDSTYNSESIEKIYLSGDGASWIKQGQEWIKDSIYVLDRFHLSKYVKKATAHMKGMHQMMWHYINNHEKKFVRDLFNAIIDATESETKVESVKDAKRYILSNWEGIMNQYNNDYVGCSAEGHISHILSSRLSSRPLSWSKQGVDQMSRLRVFKANGGNVYDLLLAKKIKKQREEKTIRLDNRMIKNAAKKISRETIDNIPAIQVGRKTWERDLFKAIRSA